MATRRRDLPASRSAYCASLSALALIASAFAVVSAVGSPLHWWLGCIPLIPLFIVIRYARPLRAMLAGGLWGFCVYLFSLRVPALHLEPSLLSAALLTAIPAAYAALMARVTRRAGFSPLLLGIGWMGVELALHPIGLRYGLLAGTQGDGMAVRVLGGLTGYVLVAFLVAYVNALLLSVLTRILRSASAPRVLPGVGAKAACAIARETPVVLVQFVASLRPRAPPVVG